VDFIKQFMPYASNLHYAPIFLNKFTLIWHHAFPPCAQLFSFSPRLWVHSSFMPCAQLFMKSNLGQYRQQHWLMCKPALIIVLQVTLPVLHRNNFVKQILFEMLQVNYGRMIIQMKIFKLQPKIPTYQSTVVRVNFKTK
jgi:hypothetical protein